MQSSEIEKELNSNIMPKKAVSMAELFELKLQNNAIVSTPVIQPSAHKTGLMDRIVNGVKTTVFFKENMSVDALDPSDDRLQGEGGATRAAALLSEVEASNAGCYRLLLGNGTPNSQVVCNQDQSQVVGFASEAVPGFVDLYTLKQVAKGGLAIKNFVQVLQLMKSAIEISRTEPVVTNIDQAKIVVGVKGIDTLLHQIDGINRDIVAEKVKLGKLHGELQSLHSKLRKVAIISDEMRSKITECQNKIISGENNVKTHNMVLLDYWESVSPSVQQFQQITVLDNQKTEKFHSSCKLLNEAGRVMRIYGDGFIQGCKINAGALVTAGVAKALLAAYVFMEDDCHRANIGLDSSGKVIKIDHDMSFWPITYLIKGHRKPHLSDPTKNWPISIKDLRDFPVLVDAKPWYWPATDRFLPRLARSGNARRNRYSNSDTAFFKQLRKNPEFVQEKYKFLLKTLLLGVGDGLFFKTITASNIATDEIGKKYSDDIVTLMTARLGELQKQLMQMPEFVQQVTNNVNQSWKNELIQEITNELAINHKEVDVDNIQAGLANLYDDIWQRCVHVRIEFNALISDINSATLRSLLIPVAGQIYGKLRFDVALTEELVASVNALLIDLPTDKNLVKKLNALGISVNNELYTKKEVMQWVHDIKQDLYHSMIQNPDVKAAFVDVELKTRCRFTRSKTLIMQLNAAIDFAKTSLDPLAKNNVSKFMYKLGIEQSKISSIIEKIVPQKPIDTSAIYKMLAPKGDAVEKSRFDDIPNDKTRDLSVELQIVAHGAQLGVVAPDSVVVSHNN